MNTFRVSVSKDYLVFASAHFITFQGHRCETLHGHNYRVGIAVEGTLDDEVRFVVDFSVLKRIAKRVVDAIDHKVLLPLDNPKLAVTESAESVSVSVHGVPRYVFPRTDCALLPLANSTAELLAEYLGIQVRDALAAEGIRHLALLELEVEESPGQAATYRTTL
ncbi:MAG: 6-pyruvoyl tetrahydropterin synthase family protein [Gemmatimonadales bacterium]|nr:6-pyruvoyl tetrahydropterin synthase family protein [Gemmatimonadales bacterium]